MILAVYGSLRNGGHLHREYMQGAEPLSEEIELQGFEMYSLGNYPYIVDKGDSSIVAEVYNVSKEVFKRIKSMEESAGYTQLSLQTGFGMLQLFVFSREEHDRVQRKVTNGNWLEYESERQKQYGYNR